MKWRPLAGALVGLVALTLVAAPATMADWSEQAVVSAEPVEASEVDERTPIIEFAELSPNARTVVRRTIESPEGHHTVYGVEDWPDRFTYSDSASPGHGLYAIVYGGTHYELTTYAQGGFPFVYWIYELPFVVYGLLLGRVASRTVTGERSPPTVALATVPGVAFHLLGPEFDFPLLTPDQFVLTGVLAAVALAAVLSGIVDPGSWFRPDAG